MSQEAHDGCCYRPPGVAYSDDLYSLLSTYSHLYDDVIVMGDFNAHLELDNIHSRRFKDLVKSVNLSILPSRNTFHLPSGYQSLLDLAIVKSPNKVQFFEQMSAPGFSHHDLLFMSYQLGRLKYTVRKIRFRDFRNLNIDDLNSDANRCKWDRLTELRDTDAKVEEFTKLVLGLLNKHAPLRDANVKYPPTPWLNPQILKLMKRRDRAFTKYKQKRSQKYFDKYKSLRNMCNRSVRDAKEIYISEGIASCKDEKSLWQFLRSLGINEASPTKHLDPRFSLDDLNSFFVKPH